MIGSFRAPPIGAGTPPHTPPCTPARDEPLRGRSPLVPLEAKEKGGDAFCPRLIPLISTRATSKFGAAVIPI